MNENISDLAPAGAAALHPLDALTGLGSDSNNGMKMKTETTPAASASQPKSYYSDPTLNRIANERRWGRVFGEKTMLDIMAEHCDEQTFISTIEEGL